jgi:transposase
MAMGYSFAAMKARLPFPHTPEQRAAVEALLRKSTTPQGVALRARIVLGLMDGASAYALARRFGCHVHTAYAARERFLESGVDGLPDRPRPGQPRKITGDEVRRVLDMTMHALPAEATRWSLSLMSRHAGVTRYRVARIWSEANLRPHLLSTFNFSSDPDFAEKVIDIIGLYMNAPEGAIVLSIDEKTQIQALDHTQPLLQLRPGQVERHMHDYVRHGTTNLYAAFELQSGKVIGRCAQRHRAKEFLSFLRLVDRRMRARKDHGPIHVVLDNSSTHKTQEVRAWLAEHPDWHFHFTPTSSSWLNAVESWFSRVERYGLRGKAFHAVSELREHLARFIVEFNRTLAKPFVWLKSPDSVLASVARARDNAAVQKDRVILSRTKRTRH